MKLLETIRLENGRFNHLDLHQERINRSRKELLGITAPIDLVEVLQGMDCNSDGLYKCRIIYSKTIESVSFNLYTPSPIHSLKLVEDDQIDYAYKYLDRQSLNNLYEKRNGCDDVLIVKKGKVTDSSYANVLFFDGHNWQTPSSPLLKGIQRSFLLMQGRIMENEIRPSDLKLFQKARLINAMIRFEDEKDIEIQKITT